MKRRQPSVRLASRCSPPPASKKRKRRRRTCDVFATSNAAGSILGRLGYELSFKLRLNMAAAGAEAAP